jgi:hypothetical protein
MGTFLVFILKSTVCMSVFYPFYKLLLSRDTFHRFNRAALLSIVCLSILIPLCEARLQKPVAVQLPVLEQETIRMISTITETATAGGTPAPLWIRILPAVYAGGALFFFGRFVLSCLRMFRLMRRGMKRRYKGLWLIITPEAVVSFSWMRYILISEKDWFESGEDILAHEMAHIKNGHSVDLLFAEACVALHWFNPAAWLLKRELQHVHEYEADESVIQKGADAKRYQLLLIKKAVGAQRFTSVANSFNHSTLKKRIAMMLKKKSNPWARLKYLYVLPLAVCAIAAFARPDVSLELRELSSVELSGIVAERQMPPDTAFASKIIAALDTGMIAKAREELEKVRPELEKAMEYIHSEEIQKSVVEALEKARPELEKAMEYIHSEEMQKTIVEELEKAQLELEKAREEIAKAMVELEKTRTETRKGKIEKEEE